MRNCHSKPLRVQLPGHEVEAAPPAPVPSRPEPRTPARGRVMVIDDEVVIRRTLERLLGKEHEVVLYATGQEALDHLEQDPEFDVIVCDLMMPGLTGMDMYDTLGQRQPDLASRMIFLTGGAFDERARHFFGRVDNIKLDKPFDIKGLRSVIRQQVSVVRADGAERGRSS